jgi:hypothetical protein
MNGEYIPPFDPETMRRLGPRYWRDETSGHLARAVEAYLAGRELTPGEVGYLRAYFRQWVNAPIWDANPHGTAALAGLRDAIGSLTNRAQVRAWLERALAEGIDPL